MVSYRKKDRASALVIDHLKIVLTSSLIATQKMGVVSHTMCVHVGRHKNLGHAGAPPLLVWKRS